MTVQSTVLLVIWFWLSVGAAFADTDSGCPFWGCLPTGSFTLSSGIPQADAQVRWKAKLEEGPSSSTSFLDSKGCVSDQRAVVCATDQGYTSIDPVSGKKLWNYTTQATPTLPVMDVYGNIIGMDSKALYSIRAGGFPQPPLNLSELAPRYSLMITNNSLLLVTSSNKKTNQIVTYTADGLIDAGLTLRGTVDGVSGTFLPCGQPVISGFRAFIITCFSSDSRGEYKEHHRLSGKLRLYAIDITGTITSRISIAWHVDIDTNTSPWYSSQKFEQRTFHIDSKPEENTLDAIILHLNGKIYINVPEGLGGIRGQNLTQPWPGRLWAVQDTGSSGSVIFNVSCLYGPMAVYEVYGKSGWNKLGAPPKNVIWIMNRSPALLQGFDSDSGQLLPSADINKILGSLGGWITSKMAVTRTKATSSSDQLVFGISDSTGQAKLVVIQIDTDSGQAELAFIREVSSKYRSNRTGHTYSLCGQVVNFAFIPSTLVRSAQDKSRYNFTLGLSAVVMDMTEKSFTRSVIGVF